MVANIEKSLAAADQAHAAAFAGNLKNYTAELDKLDADNEAAFARIPADQRKLVTNHGAFGYYVDRYRSQFVGSIIPSLDTSAELSAKQLKELVTKIKATGTKAIFAETSLPPKSAEAIANQAGVKVIGGEDALYGDSIERSPVCRRGDPRAGRIRSGRPGSRGTGLPAVRDSDRRQRLPLP
ncbi:metal ABC transporter substrate-binding protein [Micromonospora luteifusca]